MRRPLPCIDRDALIASVYPYVEDGTTLEMDSFLPKTHWAYGGPYADLPMFDPEAGKALLDEAGWTQADGAPVRTNADGELAVAQVHHHQCPVPPDLVGCVMIQNLADCGIQIIPTYAPGSWWFGDTTGLARRDFELGAFAWVGQADPAGRTLYACNQVPLPSNNWEGQNYMGWCNETASEAIVQATNTLLREDRAAAYNIVQQEFAKDVVSIPVFQRAEAEAWSTNLEGPTPMRPNMPPGTLPKWTLADGGDTIVIGMTQEPDSLWQARFPRWLPAPWCARPRATSAAATALASTSRRTTTSSPGCRTQLSTIEAGLATNNDVEVAAGDMVYNVDRRAGCPGRRRHRLRQGQRRPK